MTASKVGQRMQCDQTFCEKIAQFAPNIAQNEALMNCIFYPKKLLIKMWDFLKQLVFKING
jgi:hypothetical protein